MLYLKIVLNEKSTKVEEADPRIRRPRNSLQTKIALRNPTFSLTSTKLLAIKILYSQLYRYNYNSALVSTSVHLALSRTSFTRTCFSSSSFFNLSFLVTESRQKVETQGRIVRKRNEAKEWYTILFYFSPVVWNLRILVISKHCTHRERTILGASSRVTVRVHVLVAVSFSKLETRKFERLVLELMKLINITGFGISIPQLSEDTWIFFQIW